MIIDECCIHSLKKKTLDEFLKSFSEYSNSPELEIADRSIFSADSGRFPMRRFKSSSPIKINIRKDFPETWICDNIIDIGFVFLFP